MRMAGKEKYLLEGRGTTGLLVGEADKDMSDLESRQRHTYAIVLHYVIYYILSK